MDIPLALNNDFDLLDDHELVDGILRNDRRIIEYFFNRKCSKLFSYILLNVFGGNTDKWELLPQRLQFGVEKKIFHTVERHSGKNIPHHR